MRIFCFMGWKSLNLLVKPGISFFVGGHKVCRLEHKTTFSFWPYRYPLIFISSNKPHTHSCFTNMLWGLTVSSFLNRTACAHTRVLALEADPALGYVMCLQEEGSVVQQENDQRRAHESPLRWFVVFKLHPGCYRGSPHCSSSVLRIFRW